MKKAAFVFLFSFVGLSYLGAQTTLIPKFGSSFSTMLYSDGLKPDGDIKSKFGIVTGFALNFPLQIDKLSIQAELLVHQKGYRYWATSMYGTSFESRTTINYLEIPVLAKMKFGKFYGVVGPSFSVGFGGRVITTQSYSGSSNTTTRKIKFGDNPGNNGNNNSDEPYYFDNRFDVGVQAGAGVNVSVITIELRYDLGLISLNDYDSDYFKNGSFFLTVGFPIGETK